jgi:hypothetical protein
VRDRLDEFGDATVALVLFTRPRNLAGYRARFVDPLTVLTDESRVGYRAFGFPRGPWWKVWGPAVWRRYATLVRGGATFERPTEDTLQLGGDVVIGADGRIASLFRSSSPDERPPVDDLVAAVRASR